MIIWHTQIIKCIHNKVKSLPYLDTPYPHAFIIVETHASNIGFGGILKQCRDPNIEQLKLHNGGMTGF